MSDFAVSLGLCVLPNGAALGRSSSGPLACQASAHAGRQHEDYDSERCIRRVSIQRPCL
jgi:hypothetical protein